MLFDRSKGRSKSGIKKNKARYSFNGLHGRYGEDGYIQSILENEKIKYTHSGVLSSFLAMDKYLSKKIFKENNILSVSFKHTFSNNISHKKLLSKAHIEILQFLNLLMRDQVLVFI